MCGQRSRKGSITRGWRSFSLPEVRAQLGNILEVWQELFPAEQTRLIRQIVREIVVSEDGMKIHLHSRDLSALVQPTPIKTLEAAE